MSLWFNISLSPAHAQDTPRLLEPLTPATITLNRFTPTATFTFEAQAGELWSILVFAFNIELDPVVALYDSSGNLLLANDNETNASKDARLEGWIAPESGVYTVEISRAGENPDRFFGSATVTLLPGYSIALQSPDSTVRVRSDALRLAELPFDTQQVYAQFTVDFEDDQSFSIQMIPLTGEGWRMFFGEAISLIGSGDEPPEIENNLSPGTYTLFLDQESAALEFNGEPLYDLPNSEFPLFSDAQSLLELVGDPANTLPMSVSDISVTVPFYDAESLATAQLPAEKGTRLYTFDRDPFQIMLELQELGYLAEEDNGAMLMQIPRGMITTTEAGFSTYPLNLGRDVQDFVLGFQSQTRMDTPGIACGMTFRQVDASNFATVLVSNDGSVYLLGYTSGELTAASRALISPLVREGSDTQNMVHLVAQGEEITVFINGTRLDTFEFTPQAGTMHLNISLPEEGYTLCMLDNIWLWSLD